MSEKSESGWRCAGCARASSPPPLLPPEPPFWATADAEKAKGEAQKQLDAAKAAVPAPKPAAEEAPAAE